MLTSQILGTLAKIM